ncbi:hypothetical protein [uncultured Methylobacterium sp.]|uniref:hypothetical protein n=1 Tax=uncultured Methylobacterium sp. TaxID=157278 RepID=UPI00258A8ED9|nr:hypothetical protein [uncultured Methylobacterium sp.]
MRTIVLQTNAMEETVMNAVRTPSLSIAGLGRGPVEELRERAQRDFKRVWTLRALAH